MTYLFFASRAHRSEYDGSRLNAIRYPVAGDKAIFTCKEPAGGAVPRIEQFLKSPSFIAQPVVTISTCQEIPPDQVPPMQGLLLALARFAAWLQDSAGHRNPTAAKEWLLANVSAPGELSEGGDLLQRLVSAEVWRDLRAAVGDSLVAAVAAGIVDQAAYLSGLLRTLSVMELLARPHPADEAAIARTAAGSYILLPPWTARARAELRGFVSAPMFARQPAFSDLVVIREEWSCFVAGEIAHIENIMAGELKDRVHRRLEETETKEQTETATTTSEERDTQSTERASLKEETQNQTRFQVGVQGQVDTSGQYGPTHVETHLGAQLSYSAETTRSRANEQSREIVNRAVSKVEATVQEMRSRRTLTRVVELNRHKFDNTGETREHITGIYRWVDRIVRLQSFLYRHRFLLEFQVPEPAAFLRVARKAAPDPDVLVPKPPDFVNEKGTASRRATSHATPTCGGSERLAQPASCRRRSRLSTSVVPRT